MINCSKENIRGSSIFGVYNDIGLKEAFMASGVWQHIQLLHEFDVDAAIAAANKVRGIYQPAGQES